MVFLGSAVSEIISDIDTTLAILEEDTDEDAIIKLTRINSILGSDLFGKRRKRSVESKTIYFLATRSIVLLSQVVKNG